MAKDVAATMGVELEVVAVQSSNRMQFLEQGKIDLMIATMSDRADRREIVGIVGPNYYTSGTNILAPDALDFTDWEQLRDRPVCGKQGAFYNQIVEERYGAKIVAFTGNAEAKQALRDKKCVAFVYDDSSDRGRPRLGRVGRVRDAAEDPRTTIRGRWRCPRRSATASSGGSCRGCSTTGTVTGR